MRNKYLYALASLGLICYVVFRAYTVGPTYDEIWTLDYFVPLEVLHIINYTPCDANNHIINTLLIKLLHNITGSKSFFLIRLPNMLAFAGYLYYAYRICNDVLKGLAGICLFLLLTLNPFLIDFFSIARGYGLALAFMLGAIYYPLQLVNTASPRMALYSLALGGLAVLSNFSFLSMYCGLAGIIHLQFLMTRPSVKQFLLFTVRNLVVIGIVAGVAYEPIRKMIEAGSLYYGGTQNFYSDTLVTLAEYSGYTTYSVVTVEWVLNTFLCVLAVAFVLSMFRKQASASETRPKNWLFFMLCLCIIINLVQFYALGTRYLIDRTALFYYPLFMLVFAFALGGVVIPMLRNTAIVFLAAFTAIIIADFAANANFYKTALWYFDANTEEILSIVNKKGRADNKKMKVYSAWPYGNSMGYHLRQQQYDFVLYENKRDDAASYDDADIYIHLNASMLKVGYDHQQQSIFKYSFDTLASFPEEHTYVLQHIHPKQQ